MAHDSGIGNSDQLGQPLSLSFFDRDPRLVAPDLLGRLLVSVVDGELTAGRIVETEAYLGDHDPGSHAATKGITKRNAVMYGPPGSVYVYFTYGNHHMLNLVCLPEGHAGAVLIRALEPVFGVDAMRRRRGRQALGELCSGPGKLASALAVDLSDNGSVLGVGRVRVYAGDRPDRDRICTSGRVGLTNGHELEYRYFIRDNPFVSRGRTGLAPVRDRTRARGGGS